MSFGAIKTPSSFALDPPSLPLPSFLRSLWGLTRMVVSFQAPDLSAVQVVVKDPPTGTEVDPEGSEGSGAA